MTRKMLRRSTAVLTSTLPLLAAAPAVARETEGLPQISQTETFASQIFWLIITFAVLYYLVARKLLPRLGQVVEGRQEKIDDDLDRAGHLRGEAEAVMETYEKALASARAEASGILKAANEEIKINTTRRLETIAQQQAEQTREEEAAIAQAMTRARGELADMASEAAQAVTQKLVEVTPEAKAARAAVEEAMETRS